MARTKWPEGLARDQRAWSKCWYEPITDPAFAELALRFTLGLPITAAVPPGHAELWEIAYRVAADPKPLSAEEEARLRAQAAQTEPLFRNVA